MYIYIRGQSKYLDPLEKLQLLISIFKSLNNNERYTFIETANNILVGRGTQVVSSSFDCTTNLETIYHEGDCQPF